MLPYCKPTLDHQALLPFFRNPAWATWRQSRTVKASRERLLSFMAPGKWVPELKAGAVSVSSVADHQQGELRFPGMRSAGPANSRCFLHLEQERRWNHLCGVTVENQYDCPLGCSRAELAHHNACFLQEILRQEWIDSPGRAHNSLPLSSHCLSREIKAQLHQLRCLLLTH